MTDIRADLVHVFIFRRTADDPEFLQLLRTNKPAAATWQPVMGSIQKGETAVEAAWREVQEETGRCLDDPALLGMWSLEQAPPFFLHEQDLIIISPRFAMEVAGEWQPTLNCEHSDSRWVGVYELEQKFTWPTHIVSCREIVDSLLRPGSLSEVHLRVVKPG